MSDKDRNNEIRFDEVLEQVLQLLRREGRLSYRALKRRFSLDDEYIEDLKAEIIEAKRLAVDENGTVLVLLCQVYLNFPSRVG